MRRKSRFRSWTRGIHGAALRSITQHHVIFHARSKYCNLIRCLQSKTVESAQPPDPFPHLRAGSGHETIPSATIAAVQRRLCTRHRLHHVRLRDAYIYVRPRNPVNPLSQYFLQNGTLAFASYECFPWHTLGHINNREIARSWPA